ncbi:hypothetical protein ACFQZC_31110 [Streptacidiphilus monticola]
MAGAAALAAARPWPARLAGGGVLCAGLGVGAYFFGLGVHAAGTGLWAVAAVLLGAGFLRHGLGGGSGRVNIRIDNRNSR